MNAMEPVIILMKHPMNDYPTGTRSIRVTEIQIRCLIVLWRLAFTIRSSITENLQLRAQTRRQEILAQERR
jgi:hypothetical protein